MKRRFIDRFDVILLDLALTFMFGVDRFSAADDVAATYRQIGGRTLSDRKVRQIIAGVFDTMSADARHPQSYDRFPAVHSYLETLSQSQNLSKNERQLLEHVFALHEVGVIPDSHAEALCYLSKTHRLGVVSDIWSRSDLFLREFARAGIHNLFDIILFSSDHGHLKPSPYPFLQAIVAFPVDRAKIVFVGDSLRRDIAGAKAAGLSTVWINPEQGTIEADVPKPDLVVQDLRELLEA